jgi:hypothetical protein
MKFDVIVGNPPFQDSDSTGRKKHASANLWVKIWYRSFDLLERGGIISLICPIGWTSPTDDERGKKRLWDIFNAYSTFAKTDGVKEFFPGVGSTFSYVIVNTKSNDGLKFSDGFSGNKLGFKPMSGYSQVQDLLDRNDNLKKEHKVSRGCNDRNEIRISIPMTRVLSENHIEILRENENPTMGTYDPGTYYYVSCKDMIDAMNVKKAIVRCLDVLNIHCRWSGFLNRIVVEMIKFQPTEELN